MCGNTFHTQCCSFDVTNMWICSQCISNELPFCYTEDIMMHTHDLTIPPTAAQYNATNLRLEVLTEEFENRTLINNVDTDPDLNCFSNAIFDSVYLSPHSLSSKFALLSSSSLSIVHINCRSLLPKLTEIRDLLDILPVSILALSETWIDKNSEDLVNLPGYQFVHRPREQGHWGGVGFFIKNELSFSIVQNVKCTNACTYEGLLLRIPMKTGSILVGILYRPPGQELDKFTDEVEALLSELSPQNKDIILLGDFNIDLLKVNIHKQTTNFYNCLLAHHFLPIITRPTRITDHSATLIDHIFTTAWPRVAASSIITSDISDHLPTFVHLNCETKLPTKSATDNFRIISNEGISTFQEALSTIDWSPITQACINYDPNKAYDDFMTIYKELYDRVFPISVSRGRKVTLKNPWMSQGLLKSCKTKNSLYLKYIKNPNETNRKKFITFRNKFKSIRKRAEINYYAEEFCKCSNNLKKTWNVIRSAIGLTNNESVINSLNSDGVKIEDPEEIANKFNSYFTEIAQNLAKNIPDPLSPLESYLSPPITNSFGLEDTTSEEIIKLNQTIRLSHSKGIDDIDPFVASPSINIIAQPLSEIVNCSFNTGIFPSALKIAKVVPIFKRGERSDVANYRPISVLPYFAKIFEKLMYKRLSSFLEKSSILYPSQHGFQAGHSPSLPLLSIQDKISEAIENNEFSLGVFFDLAKAFDTVSHDILLKKLNNYGIRGVQHKWFASYLENRSQVVYCNGAYSMMRSVLFGVPQGSNLGPLLFLLFINDLPNASPLMYFILFADDTNIFYSHSSLTSLYQIVNGQLSQIANWFRANKLSLNLDKTNYILFRSHRKISFTNENNLYIDGHSIKQETSTKFLGVVLDQHLSWKDHIKAISSKIAKNIGIIKRASSLLPPHVRLTLYYTLIYPYLTYCNIIWASTYKSNLQRLTILQKRVIRYVANVPYNSHTHQLFLEFKLLKIEQIRTVQIGEFMFRYEHNLLPVAYRQMFFRASDFHSYSTRSSNLYRQPFAHTNTRLFSIRYTGANIWNSIPSAISQLHGLHIFKKRLRCYIINRTA